MPGEQQRRPGMGRCQPSPLGPANPRARSPTASVPCRRVHRAAPRLSAARSGALCRAARARTSESRGRALNCEYCECGEHPDRGSGGPMRQPAASLDSARTFLKSWPWCGRLAQRESVPFTRERSQVRSLQRPPANQELSELVALTAPETAPETLTLASLVASTTRRRQSVSARPNDGRRSYELPLRSCRVRQQRPTLRPCSVASMSHRYV